MIIFNASLRLLVGKVPVNRAVSRTSNSIFTLYLLPILAKTSSSGAFLNIICFCCHAVASLMFSTRCISIAPVFLSMMTTSCGLMVYDFPETRDVSLTHPFSNATSALLSFSLLTRLNSVPNTVISSPKAWIVKGCSLSFDSLLTIIQLLCDIFISQLFKFG